VTSGTESGSVSSVGTSSRADSGSSRRGEQEEVANGRSVDTQNARDRLECHIDYLSAGVERLRALEVGPVPADVLVPDCSVVPNIPSVNPSFLRRSLDLTSREASRP
jgi:hypothetical protein